MIEFKPTYQSEQTIKKMDSLIEEIYSSLSNCTICPRNCRVNRLKDEKGDCNTGYKALVSSYGPHFGEEKPLVGNRGSGTIFFTNCNLLCNFCQNFDISHYSRGKEVSSRELADIMLYLQDIGCHNINFVTPTHVVPQILKALKIAIQKGLSIPLVYNSSGYDKDETIKKLEGIFDIYMPDFKFWNPDFSEECCNANDYHVYASSAIKEMHKQVGILNTNKQGIANKGLIIRHLIMPNKLANSRKIIDFIASELSEQTYVNFMDQYRPCYKASENIAISRSISNQEYESVIEYAQQKGMTNLDD